MVRIVQGACWPPLWFSTIPETGQRLFHTRQMCCCGHKGQNKWQMQLLSWQTEEYQAGWMEHHSIAV